MPATAATVFAPLPQPVVAAQPERKPRRGWLWIGAVVLALVLLLGVTAAFLNGRAPKLSVPPGMVARGELVRVTATNVPANQAGELQLHSVIHTFAFRASSAGKVDVQVQIPFDVGLGDHRIDLCWNGSCRASTQIRVIAGGGGVALASPSPSSGSTSPTPGVSPSPGTSPGKSASPKPTHQPSPSPTPTTVQQPSITVTPTTVHTLSSRNITVTGANWPPNTTVTITYSELSVITKQIGNQNVASNGSFSWNGGIPSAALPGSAAIRVCDGGTCVSKTITVTT